MRLPTIACVLTSAFLAAGCQTSGIRPHVNKELATTGLEVIEATCRIVNSAQPSKGGSAPARYQLLINNAVVQADGWVWVDFSYNQPDQRLNGTAIYNLRTLKGGCSENKQQTRLLQTLVAHAVLNGNGSKYSEETLRDHIKDATYPLQVTWAGDNRIYHGEYIFKQPELIFGAWLALETPYDSQRCIGSFASPNTFFRPEPYFGWAVTCPNGTDLRGKMRCSVPRGHVGAPKKMNCKGTDNHDRAMRITVVE